MESPVRACPHCLRDLHIACFGRSRSWCLACKSADEKGRRQNDLTGTRARARASRLANREKRLESERRAGLKRRTPEYLRRKRAVTAARDLAAHNARAIVIRCIDCSVDFCPVFGRQSCARRCSPCSAAHARAYVRTKITLRRKWRTITREVINRLEVFEAHAWTCAICMCATPKQALGTHRPDAPELDHRIPKARGGTHTRLNVQLLCRQCNQIKHDRAEISSVIASCLLARQAAHAWNRDES